MNQVVMSEVEVTKGVIIRFESKGGYDTEVSVILDSIGIIRNINMVIYREVFHMNIADTIRYVKESIKTKMVEYIEMRVNKTLITFDIKNIEDYMAAWNTTMFNNETGSITIRTDHSTITYNLFIRYNVLFSTMNVGYQEVETTGYSFDSTGRVYAIIQH